MIHLAVSERLSPSLEDYLEVIFHLVEEDRVARAKSIAQRMAVSKSSVTGALKHLAQKGMIRYGPYSYVTLTPEGEVQASRIVRRHNVLCEFLSNTLGLPARTADDNACRMEHAIDDRVLARLLRFVEFLASSGLGDGFRQYCQERLAHADADESPEASEAGGE